MFRTGSSKQNNIFFVAVGIVALTLTVTSLYYMFNFFGRALKPQDNPGVVYKKPLPGHWLRTSPAGTDQGSKGQGRNREDEGERAAEEIADRGSGALGEDEEGLLELTEGKVSHRHLNKELDSTNVLYIWTDNDNLRVVSVMTLNNRKMKPAIVVIPLQTVINSEGETLQEVYLAKGREAVKKQLETKLEVKLHNYVHIDNNALYAISEILGTLNLHNEKVTMAQALEESAAGLRTNDETIVREVAMKAIHPSTWLKLPRLVKVFQEHIKSDLSIGEMLQILNFTRQLKVENTEKAVLTGRTVFVKGRYCKVVEADKWQNCLYDVTE